MLQEEMKEGNQFGNIIDVRYMETLRAINDKIKSCISCNENKTCPILKERMNRHVIKHRSFTSSARLSAQNWKPAKIHRNSILMSDDQTYYINNYNILLRDVIEEWSKGIPTYPNQIFEIKKQNLIDLLTKNINDMVQNIDDEDYNFKLENVVNSFLNSLSGLEKEKPIKGKLKESLLDHIYKLNNDFQSTKGNKLSRTADIKRVSNAICQDPIATKLIKIPKQPKEDKDTSKRSEDYLSTTKAIGIPNPDIKSNSSFAATKKSFSQEKGHLHEILHDPSFNFTKENRLVEDVATNTDNTLKFSKMLNNSTNTVIEYYNKVIGPDIVVYDKRNEIKNYLANAQIQVSRSIINNSIFEQNQERDSKRNNIKFLFKRSVISWMDTLIENDFLNRKVDKHLIANIIWDELNVHLTNQSNEQHKLILKRKILDIIDEMPLSTPKLNTWFKYKIAEDLNKKLMNLDTGYTNKYVQSKQYFESHNKISITIKKELRNILLKSLKSFGLHNIQYEMINIFLQILIKNNNTKCIKEELYIVLEAFFDLPPSEIFELVNIIIERTRYFINDINCNDHSTTRSFGSAALTIYPSEQELNGPTTSCKRKSSLRLQEVSKLSSNEVTRVNKIVEIINLWLDTLPKEFKSCEKKDDNVRDLAGDIYNQILLQEKGEETATESNKFKIFIIRKWLNRFDFFENPFEADPYIELLVKDINNISPVSIKQQQDSLVICCGTKPQNKDSEPECLMKNLILTFFEYNFSEDKTDTRLLFAYLLKAELPNLCLPSRKEVYDSLERNMLDYVQSFKRLDTELQYIMAICEFVQNTTLYYSSFTNKQRNELINRLANNIYLVKQNVMKSTNLEELLEKFVKEFTISISSSNAIIVGITFKELLNKITEIQTSPICCIDRKSQFNSSINTLHTLSDYIESFICDNYNKLADDELVLEACSVRLLKEINNIIIENPNAFNTTEVYKRLGNDSMSSSEIVRRFSAVLKYAKEISNWLHNLPLLPVLNENDLIGRFAKIKELIHKVREYTENIGQKLYKVNTNIKEYIEKWLKTFPIDSSKEIIISVVIQQLLNRIERINIEKPKQESNIICQAPVPCCSYGKSNFNKTLDPAEVIVETIEKWCNDLPLNGESDNINILRNKMATKLYQKIGDINNNFMYFNNDELYRDVLSREIDKLLETVPLNKANKFDQEYLKNKLLNIIMDSKKILNKKILGNDYKQRLKEQIAISVPYPVSVSGDDDPGFEIYKDRLATIFILDNFDYSHNAVKMKYEKKIREQIDKFHECALKRHAISITNEQMFVELYSALFHVPIPNDETVYKEVEEIKTRCEIEIWFENLPLRKAMGLEKLLQWDRKLTMLARRIHEIENNEINPDNKLYKEIIKWLRKLPLLLKEKANIDQFASELQIKLKSTFALRKCVTQIDISRLLKKINSRIPSVPYRENQTQTPLPKCCQIRPKEIRKPADLIIETVESWCRDLPIPANTPKEKEDVSGFKDNTVIKIIMKISELNMNPEIFNNKNLYNTLLDDELETILTSLPKCCNYMNTKNIRKEKLIEAINSIKPMISEENSRYKYKQDLKNVVNDILGKPDVQNLEIVSEIVDNFVIYHYYNDDIDDKQNYKIMINNAVKKYIRNGNISINDTSTDTLFKSNQLICELSKVPTPNIKVLVDEVEEIRMKSEVSEFLKELPVNGDVEKVPIIFQTKTILSTRLSDLEKSGHSHEIEQKMKDEVIKCLRKINENIDNIQIDSFVERLRNTEPLRKSHPQHIYDNNVNYDTFMTAPIANASSETRRHLADYDISLPQANSDGDQWLSLLPATPQAYQHTIKNRDNLPFNQNTLYSSIPTKDGQNLDHEVSYRTANKQAISVMGPISANNSLYNRQSKCSSHLSNPDNNLSFTPNVNTKSFYRNNESPNQKHNSDINAENFKDEIRITSTPMERYEENEQTKYEMLDRRQQSSISLQSNQSPKSNTNINQGYYPRISIPAASDTNQSIQKQLELSGLQLNDSPSPQKQYYPDIEENRPHCPRYQISSDRIPNGCSNCNILSAVETCPCRRIHKHDKNYAFNQGNIQGDSSPCKRKTSNVIGSKNTSQSCLKQLENQIASYECDEHESYNETGCTCSNKILQAKPSCGTHNHLKNKKNYKKSINKHCKTCDNKFTTTTCRYPGFYYY